MARVSGAHRQRELSHVMPGHVAHGIRCTAEWVLAAHLYVKRRHRDELIEPIERLVTAVAVKGAKATSGIASGAGSTPFG